MTIKKPVKNTTATQTANPAEATAEVTSTPAVGGAAIADRFKLDAPDPNAAKKATAASKGAKFAAIAGLLGLVVAGVLVYTLWKHWEFLMPA